MDKAIDRLERTVLPESAKEEVSHFLSFAIFFRLHIDHLIRNQTDQGVVQVDLKI